MVYSLRFTVYSCLGWGLVVAEGLLFDGSSRTLGTCGGVGEAQRRS
jgi:hypothetical protein